MPRNTKPKGWSFVAGERGTNRVRAYDRGARGLYVEWRETGERPSDPRRRVRLALGRITQDEAKAKAEEIAVRFRKAEPAKPAHTTLASLFDIYEREVTPSKVPTVQAHDRRALEMFVRYFGASRNPATLSRREWDAFVRDRFVGRIAPKGVTETRKVRARPVQQDLQTLRAVLTWATRAGDGKGGTLLDRNPLEGLEMPREESPRRMALTGEQYTALRTAARQRSPRAELFVVLAHETGHRGASIRQLRWSDVDLERRTVRWRGETDKIKNEHSTPLTEDAATVLARVQAEQGAIGDAWVFPALRGDRSKAMSADAAMNLFKQLAAAAGIPAGKRYGWHSLRRKFATELRHVPLKDLGDLGGWKSPQTIITCYIGSSDEAQREALADRRKPGTKAVSGLD